MFEYSQYCTLMPNDLFLGGRVNIIVCGLESKMGLFVVSSEIVGTSVLRSLLLDCSRLPGACLPSGEF